MNVNENSIQSRWAVHKPSISISQATTCDRIVMEMLKGGIATKNWVEAERQCIEKLKQILES